MALACVLLGICSSLFPVSLVVSSAAEHLLLFHTSTPLTVQRIPMHFDIMGGSITVTLRLRATTCLEIPGVDSYKKLFYV